MLKYHYIYKITNLIDGKYYIGMHSTNKLNDSYFGSGNRLMNAIKKYGRENFNKEILGYHDSREELAYIESLIVSQETVDDPKSYNIKTGGLGGVFKCSQETKEKIRNAHIGKKIPEETKKKMSDSAKGKKKTAQHAYNISKGLSGEKNYMYGTHHSGETKKKISIANTKEKNGFYGKSHTEESRLKISESKKNLSEQTILNISNAAKEAWKRRKEKQNDSIS